MTKLNTKTTATKTFKKFICVIPAEPSRPRSHFGEHRSRAAAPRSGRSSSRARAQAALHGDPDWTDPRGPQGSRPHRLDPAARGRPGGGSGRLAYFLTREGQKLADALTGGLVRGRTSCRPLP